MDKLIFLFRRKEGLTRKEFFDHYLDVHAPLGKRVTQTMRGYTVNLVDTESGLDAVTEIWTESAADFMDPAKSFATPEDAAELMADHDSFLGPFEAYIVEEKIVSGEVSDAPLGAVGPSSKLVSLHHDAHPLSDDPGAALGVVENRVVQKITPDGRDFALIRLVWAPDAEAFGALEDDAVLVREYRQMEPGHD